MDQLTEMTVTFRAPRNSSRSCRALSPPCRAFRTGSRRCRKRLQHHQPEGPADHQEMPAGRQCHRLRLPAAARSDLKVENGKSPRSTATCRQATSGLPFADRLPRQRPGRRHAVFRRRSLHHRVQRSRPSIAAGCPTVHTYRSTTTIPSPPSSSNHNRLVLPGHLSFTSFSYVCAYIAIDTATAFFFCPSHSSFTAWACVISLNAGFPASLASNFE